MAELPTSRIEIVDLTELLAEVFEVYAAIMTDPVHGRPICIPRGRARRAAEKELNAVA